MISFTEAIDIVAAEISPAAATTVALGEAVGRVLAEDIVADTDMPPFNRSQMDGYAVLSSDTKKAPVRLKIIGESAAGKGWDKAIGPGEAVRIMTGAPVPPGADGVERLEDAGEDAPTQLKQREDVESPGTVRISKAVEPGKFIIPKGAEIMKGERVFRAGEAITPQMIASLAAFGYAQVGVGRRPKVAVLATGSEIVPVTETPGTDQIRNSNSPMLTALACKFGNAEELPIIRDSLDELKTAIAAAAYKNDLVIITGGVSVGKYDLTKDALRHLGAEIFFERVRLKPGKPTVFARLGETLIFGLPGNPISAAVTFHLFVRFAMLKMQGASSPHLRHGHAAAASKLKGTAERDAFLPAVVGTDETGRTIATATKWLGSSDFVGFARAEALAFVPAGQTFEAGDIVRIYFL